MKQRRRHRIVRQVCAWPPQGVRARRLVRMTARAPLCSLLAMTAVLFGTAPPLSADTSSWIMKSTEVPKPNSGKPVKVAPNEKFAKPAQSAQPIPQAQGKGFGEKLLAEPSGDEAPYIAFDQGQYLTAAKLAREAATKGDPQAHTLMGRLYAEGLGVSKDLSTAIKWYAHGDELGDVQSTFALAVLLAEGRGVKKDRKLSAELFEKAARQGHPQANYNLGLLFMKGDGKPQNPYRAAMHIRYAAEKGVAVAQYDLASMYQNATGVEPSALEAARWLSKAAEQGMPEAQFDYAVVLLRGLGLTKDEPKAIPYLHTAAQKGLVAAQNRLAHVYAQGVGVKKDPKEAAKWRFIAQAGGLKDEELDAFVEKLPRAQRLAAQQAAMEWREDAGMF